MVFGCVLAISKMVFLMVLGAMYLFQISRGKQGLLLSDVYLNVFWFPGIGSQQKRRHLKKKNISVRPIETPLVKYTKNRISPKKASKSMVYPLREVGTQHVERFFASLSGGLPKASFKLESLSTCRRPRFTGIWGFVGSLLQKLFFLGFFLLFLCLFFCPKGFSRALPKVSYGY